MLSKKLSWRTALNVLMAALVAFLVVATPVAPASAADNPPSGMNADQWKRWNSLDAAGKAKVRDEAIIEDAKKKCEKADFRDQLGVKDRCEEVVRAGLTKAYENVDEFIQGKVPDTKICLAIAQGSPSESFAKGCANQVLAGMKKANDATLMAAFAILGKVTGVSNAIDVAKFIADPKTALDNLANDFKTQSVEGTKQVLTSLTSVTGLDANSKEFRSVWGAFAGIGVVVMTFMMLLLFKRYGEGKVSDDSFGTSMMYYLPGGFLLAIFGPGLMGLAQKWSSGLTDGASGWAAGAINNFVSVIAGFGAMQSTDWFGSVLAVILFGILLLGAFGLLVFLLLSPFFMGFAGLAVAILWGLALVPSLRPRLAKIGSVVVVMIFMKPIVFVLLGGAFSLLAATPAFKTGTDDVLVNVGSLAATGIILLMLALSPALLFKFMPVLDADDVPSGTGGAVLAGGVAGAVTGGAGKAFSTLQQNGRARRRAAADSHGGGAGTQGGGQSFNAPGSGSAGSGTQAGWGGGSGAGSTAAGGASSASPATGTAGAGARQRRGGAAWTNAGGSVSKQGTGASAGEPGATPGSTTSIGGSAAPGARSGGRRAALNAGPGGGGSSALATAAGATGGAIKSGLVGALWAGRESARAARRAASDYGQMPTSWGNFKGAPASKEQE
ncbi:hypothetical protein DWB68_13245 [Galactobacter valiniphilus]|uniref:Type IV secretion system protein n=1 Tax=Galactobacter valiniphilus TaxID=2676122 RepID=A0A399J720_9MICC|nr:hypothetical protein [Galactobacter valiniphilus]RII41303.1 hypothetical protein DWB68_13245 [Galactobacter valiniphilus]